MPNPPTARQHHYQVTIEWTGDDGQGTAGYRTYRRDHEIRAADGAPAETPAVPAPPPAGTAPAPPAPAAAATAPAAPAAPASAVAATAPPIPASSDPAFRGDPSRWNPEQLLVASLSSCHMLWYLHLCSTEGIVVTGYEDTPTGAMVEDAEGGGRFVDVTLRPNVRITDTRRVGDAGQLHHEAHRLCFIANSVNFPVRCEPHIAAE